MKCHCIKCGRNLAEFGNNLGYAIVNKGKDRRIKYYWPGEEIIIQCCNTIQVFTKNNWSGTISFETVNEICLTYKE